MYSAGAVEGVLLSLGIETTESRDELLGLCPMHMERTGKEDTNPSWSMNSETGVHHCFSCGYKGTLVSLVAELKDFTTEWGHLDFEAATDWLRNNVEVNFEYLARQLEEARNTYVSIPRPVAMSEARLAVFDTPPDWALQNRGICKDSAEAYSIKWKTGADLWITPIRDPHNSSLMGWQEKGETSRFFRNRPTGVAKSKSLFGLEVPRENTMIVVESPLDAAKLHSMGILGGVSTYGAVVSDEQIRLMKDADRLIIAMDNDPAGKKSSLDILSRTRKEGMECYFFSYGDLSFKDIGEMPEDLVRYCIGASKHSVYGEAAFL